MINNSSFYKYGFEQLNDAINFKAAKKFNNYLKKNFKVNSKIFINEKTFLSHKKKNIKFNQQNILDLYNTDFVFKNELFNKKIEEIIGKKFEIQSKKVICGLPKKFYPKWIDKYKAKDVPNLTPYLKPKFRTLRFFLGTDFHQDFIDHPNEKANYITVYIYLDKVTKNLSPLKILPRTHLGGADIYPHKIVKKNFNYIYKPSNKRIIKTKAKHILGDAGTTWFWHTCLLHGTSHNTKSIPRYSIRLILKKKKGAKGIIDLVNKKIPNIVAYKKMFR